MKRRNFLKVSVIASAILITKSYGNEETETQLPIDNRKISKFSFPEKKPMITYSDRPVLLETPREVFTTTYTPNDQFFVRWHLPEMPTYNDLKEFKINITGNVEKPLELTVEDLKNKFEAVEIDAVCQCGGNARSAYRPKIGGIRWGNGAMGCAKWKGVRVKDILKMAKSKNDTNWVGFQGADNPVILEAPSYFRELEMHEISDEVIIAYAMNGEDLPYLNGFPVRLVIPGYYSDSWIKMVKDITVLKEYKEHFYMDVAYRIPDNETESETYNNRAKKTKPITTMNVKSFIGYPTNETKITKNSHMVVRGIAFDGGSGIKDVLISLDDGKTWEKTVVKEAGKYSFHEFHYTFKPQKIGKNKIMTKAINNKGEEQPLAKNIPWNHGGYKYNGIDVITFNVIDI